MTHEMARCGWGRAGVFGWGVLLTLLLRTLAPFLASLPSSVGSGEDPLEIALWLADRDGDAVFGLDQNLHLRTVRALRRPVAICDGGKATWVLSAEQGYAAGRHALWRLGDDRPPTRVALPSGEAEIAAVRRGAVLCLQRLEGTSTNVLTLVEACGAARELLRVTAERCRLGSDGGLRALISLSENRLGLIHLPEAAIGPIGLENVELPAGPEGFAATRLADVAAYEEGWLTLEEDGVLRRLDAEGSPLWAVRSAECWGRDFEAPQLAVAHGRVWLHSRRRAWIEQRNPATGRRLGAALAGLPHGVVDLAVPWVDGGVLFAAGGALLHLDRLGKIAPGQGGFRLVSGLAPSCPVRETEPARPRPASWRPE